MSRRMHMAMNQRQQRPAMNPWEGGFAPGGAGLLPTPGASNLLSQLTSSPEAQLVVANNLLTSLLRPVQTSLQTVSQQLPPLMGMGGSGSAGYNEQQHSHYDDYSRSFDYRPRRSFESYRSRSPVRNNPKRGQQTNRGRQSSQSKTKSSSSTSEHHAEDTKDSKRSNNEKKDSSTKESGQKKGASFEGIPKSALQCHLCKKNMWDAVSFDNHVNGVAHQKMLQEREKSYMIKADLLRHDAKLEEQQHQIEIERLVRMGRRSAPSRREFCKMCDFAFFGDLASHRKSKIHQQLKHFLHPKCGVCQKEFPLRIDLDKHYLTPEHLKIMSKDENRAKSDKEKSKDKGETSAEKSKEGEEAVKGESEDVEMKDADDLETAADQDVEEIKADDNADMEVEAKSGKKDDSETPKKESVKILTYNPDVAVGQEFLIPATGMFCKACRRFFMHEDQALESHCRTIGHFNNVTALQAQSALKKPEKSEPKTPAKDTDVESKETMSNGKRLKEEPEAAMDSDIKRPKQESEIYDPLLDTPLTPEDPDMEDPDMENPDTETLDTEQTETTEENDVPKPVNSDTENLNQIDKEIDELESLVEGDQKPPNNRARRGRSVAKRGKN